MPAILIAFGGLPGTGKTTIARRLAQRIPAAYLRIDVIEQALRDAGLTAIGPAGYGVANALAVSNLALGQSVVADGVNPVAESRAAWRATAARAGAALLEVEIVCTDAEEHRRRVEGRVADIPGHAPPDWDSVTRHHYETWPEPHLILDTARLDPDAATALIASHLPGGRA
ncbi:AAA family ATPase [Roseomonas sp. CCTCC AB2023176]|uniref:AAA family ATPase n=1 Tax=Roseomonas sp. CCTCC AB2023176 TaxID=3342640 RepID=UPI0035DE034B